MSLEQRTIVDQIEITRIGVIQVRFSIQTLLGGKVVSFLYHRTAFEPGANLDGAVGTINGHLKQMGAPEVITEDWDRIRRVLDLEHTSDVVATFAKQKAEAIEAASRQARGSMN